MGTYFRNRCDSEIFWPFSGIFFAYCSYGFGTWLDRPLHALHFGDFGRTVTRFCRIDRNSTVLLGGKTRRVVFYASITYRLALFMATTFSTPLRPKAKQHEDDWKRRSPFANSIQSRFYEDFCRPWTGWLYLGIWRQKIGESVSSKNSHVPTSTWSNRQPGRLHR